MEITDKEKILEEKEKRILENIVYLGRINNITKANDFAITLGVKPATYYTFTRNPSSSSKVKSRICEYFGISMDDLENKSLKDEEDNSRYIVSNNSNRGIDNYKSIISMSDFEINKYLTDKKSNDEEINSLKRNISEKSFSDYGQSIIKARNCYENKNYDMALGYVCSAFYMLNEDDIARITKSDLELYISVVDKFNNESLLEKLVNKLLEEETYNRKIVIVLANLLETNHISLSKACYKFLNDDLI